MFIQIRKKNHNRDQANNNGTDVYIEHWNCLNVACPLRYVLGNRIHMAAVSLFFTRETVL